MKEKRNPWTWIPTLYFAEGLPYVAVMTIAVIMYKDLGLSNVEIAFYTSWLYLPWVIKPVWSPFVDLIKTKRAWIIAMQGLCGAAFAGIAFFLPVSFFLQATMAFFWLLAFSSATHDIAADGFYMLGLDSGDQSLFVGIRNTFYRLASIFGQGLLVMLAGKLAEGEVFESVKGDIPLAWSLVFYLMAALFIGIALYHSAFLPYPSADVKRSDLSVRRLFGDFLRTFITFFQKDRIGLILFFILSYRLGESQLVKIAQPFMLDGLEKGGLGLSTAEVGMLYGTIGVIALLFGGVWGGWWVSRYGFRRCILPMALAINLPDLLYVYLAAMQPDSLLIVAASVAVEQFGYGVGFAAFMLYLIYIAQGEHKTAHYSIATGLMALGMMLPGMGAGWVQEIWLKSYTAFFVWAFLCTLPGIWASWLVRKQIDPLFGKKK